MDLADVDNTSLSKTAAPTKKTGKRVPIPRAKPKAKVGAPYDDDLSSPEDDIQAPVQNVKDVYDISSDVDLSSACFEDIVRLRERICVERKIPPQYFLSNTVIQEIARVLPQNMEELAQIEGLHGNKVSNYGELILSATKKYT